MAEEWKPVVACDGLYVGIYAVSDHYRVKSLARVVVRKNGVRYRVTERVLRLATRPNGLQHVGLCVAGRRRRHYVRKLVREAGFGDT